MTSICFKYLTLEEIDRNYITNIKYNRENKEKYGEVHTPMWFIELLFELILLFKKIRVFLF